MKSEKLLSLIGDIDDKYIEEASMPYKRKPHYVRYSALAASFLVVVLIVFASLNNGLKSATDAFNNLAPETAYDDMHIVADSAATTTADSHDDIMDAGGSDFAYGFLAVITSIDAENKVITIKFSEANQYFSDTVEINYSLLKNAEPFESFEVNSEIEVLVSVNDVAEISSIRKK